MSHIVFDLFHECDYFFYQQCVLDPLGLVALWAAAAVNQQVEKILFSDILPLWEVVPVQVPLHFRTVVYESLL